MYPKVYYGALRDMYIGITDTLIAFNRIYKKLCAHMLKFSILQFLLAILVLKTALYCRFS